LTVSPEPSSRSPADVPPPSERPYVGGRRRLSLAREVTLAAVPTATVLAVLAAVEAVTTQRLLFASLASSAFLIYLDPEHRGNRVPALVLSQLGGAALGWAGYAAFGPGYAAAATALVCTILGMIVADLVHPPAVGTAMSFALRAGDASNLALFALAVGVTALLVGLQRAMLWLLRRWVRGDDGKATA
jgi:hypothetical protein